SHRVALHRILFQYSYAVEKDSTPPSWLPEKAVIHEIMPSCSRRELQRKIADIDFLEVLPLDFILTGNTDRNLKLASRREAIKLIVLT
ncbi:MAG: hypothetical protein NWS80_13850, partial [Akkermansiaceae bacterium]|nr:hypothetical protein [Akkermansiaceae bacterium]